MGAFGAPDLVIVGVRGVPRGGPLSASFPLGRVQPPLPSQAAAGLT